MSNYEQKKAEVTFDEFLKLDIRVGTVRAVVANPKARKPAYLLTIDFGPLGTLESSAQITENYTPETLVGTQVVAVVNFPSKRIAGIKSECLVLGAVSATKSVVLLSPTSPVEDGTAIG